MFFIIFISDTNFKYINLNGNKNDIIKCVFYIYIAYSYNIIINFYNKSFLFYNYQYYH